jgi:hypothetical protein
VKDSQKQTADSLLRRYQKLPEGSPEAIRARGELVVYVDASGLQRADYGLKEKQ